MGKKHREKEGKEKKKDKRQVEVNIYRVPAVNQAFYLLSQCLHAKIFQSDDLFSIYKKRKPGAVVKGLAQGNQHRVV